MRSFGGKCCYGDPYKKGKKCSEGAGKDRKVNRSGDKKKVNRDWSLNELQ